MPIHYRVDETNTAWRIADDEAVVLHADSSAYFGLNRTGTRIWIELTRRSMSLADLAAWIRRNFADAPAGLDGEVTAFVDELFANGLIIADEAPADQPPMADAAGEPSAAPILAWEAPSAEKFGELEKLILSGE